MSDLEDLLKEALRRVNEDVRSRDLDAVGPETDLFDAVDSMVIVDLLLETEALLEEKTGHYVPLADETIFDARASPLLRWSDWVAHVEQRHAQ
jgi:thioesterase domain-containing protein